MAASKMARERVQGPAANVAEPLPRLHRMPPCSRGLHSSTIQLNLSAFHGIGGARRDFVARVKGVLGGVYGVQGVFVCQTRLKLS
jgi:hypothetical protein